MKTICKLAKAELQYLFYSPIAWLIFVIFSFQAALIYCGVFEGFIFNKNLGYGLANLTLVNFSGWSGLFSGVQEYLYLYIPLLTMGIISRELSSGSIKLLYSSPISNTRIILGKYLALVIYCLAIIGILGVFAVFSMFSIVHVDIPVILSGLLGLFLLILAYAAIGLFMSSLTSYQVVAAIGTIAVLAVMNYVKGIGQEMEFIRDITYWLSITGRSETFVGGLISSEDIIYFLAIIVLFLGFAVVRLKGRRQQQRWYVVVGKFGLLFIIVASLGYFTSLPRFKCYYDATRTKQNTLTENSQKVIEKLEGGLTITTYNNLLDENFWYGLPRSVKSDMERFTQYLRFKPNIKLKYVNYYHRAKNQYLEEVYPGLSDKELIDTLRKLNKWKFKILPPEKIARDVDLEPEDYSFVRLIERESGERTFLRIYDDMMRFPGETEITAALKRLTMEMLPTVGFVTGHKERSCYDAADRGYKTFAQEKHFRYSLINQGFDFVNVNMENEVPAEIGMLVIAEPREAFSEKAMENLNRYIERGDNLMILGEPGRQEFINPITEKFGVTMLPGIIVKPGRIIKQQERVTFSTIGGKTVDTIPPVMISPELLTMKPTEKGMNWSYHLKGMERYRSVLAAPGCCALDIDTTRGFKAVPLFVCDTSWVEVETSNFVDDSVYINPKVGEKLGNYTVVTALSRNIGDKEQRIVISGDADCMSNGELGRGRTGVPASNYSLINASFFWLSNEEVPIDVRRPVSPDRDIRIGQAGWGYAEFFLRWLFPILLLGTGLLIWIRRRGR